MADVSIVAAAGAADMTVVRALFEEYQAFLNVDLCFQGFAEELAGLPGKYAAPCGTILLAKADDGSAAGVVALRPLEGGDGVCEMKRLWVRPRWRGCGLGRRLAVAVIDAARQAGYQTMVLDTLDRLSEAVSLYRALGFMETAPYYGNPLAGVVYMNLDLRAK